MSPVNEYRYRPGLSIDAGAAVNNEETMLVVTSNLAEAYGVDEDAIAVYTRAFGTTEGRQARLQRDAMHAAIINIAAAHATCDAVNCETGTEIHEALTLVMAVLRLDMDGDLAQLSDDGRPSTERDTSGPYEMGV